MPRFVLFALVVTITSLAAARADSGFCPAPASAYTVPIPPVGDVVLAQYNMRAAPDCAAFAPSGKKVDFYGFVSATRGMLDEGLSCIRQQGLVEPLARVKAVITPGGTPSSIQLVCAHKSKQSEIKVHGVPYGVTEVASALGPEHAGYPGVIFNLDWTNSSPEKSFKAAFFHELFHAAGYGHTSGVDYAYFAAGCCFEDSATACELLRRSVGKSADWWTTADYLKDAVTWFYGRDGVANDLLLAAAAASPQDTHGVLAGILQLGKNMAGTITDVSKQDLAVRCLAAGGGETCLKSFPTTKPAYTRIVGELLALNYRLLARQHRSESPDLTSVERSRVHELRAQLNNSCDSLTGGKKAFDQIRDEQGTAATASELTEAFQNLCRP